jgi:peroxiredoxin
MGSKERVVPPGLGETGGPSSAEWVGENLRRAIVLDMGERPESLFELSRRSPVLVVFLRHFGCTFCREALADVAARRAEIEGRGAKIVLVHMVDSTSARPHLAKYGLGKGSGVGHVSDPSRALYRAFDLKRGTFGQHFGPSSIVRALRAMIVDRHGLGRLAGDGFQMPGAFLVRNGAIVKAYRHRLSSDRPDYCEIAAGEASRHEGREASRGEAADAA